MTKMAKNPKESGARRSLRAPLRPGPAGGKRDSNRRRRQRQLISAALELFVERGIEAVTIDEVVGRAASAKGSFYRYFEDKTDLVASIVAPVRERITSALAHCDEATRRAQSPGELVQAYQGLALTIVATVVAYPEEVRLYLQECHGPPSGARAPLRQLADMVVDGAERLTAMAIAHGLLRPVQARVSALAVIGATERLTFDYLQQRGERNAQRTADALVTMVLDGLKAQDGS